MVEIGKESLFCCNAGSVSDTITYPFAVNATDNEMGMVVIGWELMCRCAEGDDSNGYRFLVDNSNRSF
jgi:hypothetical protein